MPDRRPRNSGQPSPSPSPPLPDPPIRPSPVEIRCPHPNCPSGLFVDYLALIAHLNAFHPGDSSLLGFRVKDAVAPNTYQGFDAEADAAKRLKMPYWPFRSEAEFEVAAWLHKNLRSTQVDSFLKLAWTRAGDLGFRTSDTLREWIELLPPTPTWKSTTLKLEGYKTVRNEPITVLYRDPLQVLRHLYGNPIWAAHLDTEPKLEYTAPHLRVWSEFNTGDRVWDLQDAIPSTSTVLPIQLGSDKITVTSHAGNIEMHPLLMTTPAIPAAIRSKLTNHAWECIAYLPVPKFDVHPRYNTLLVNRVLHMAVDLVLEPLKEAMRNGTYMTHGFGEVHMIYPPAVALSADVAEHRDMLGLSSSVSTVTVATSAQFGDGILHPRRCKAHLLADIEAAGRKYDTWKLHKFQRECKKRGLNGVHQPWLRNYPLAEPSDLAVPDLLHVGGKFFFDHPYVAGVIAVTPEELDRRYGALHRHVGQPALRRASEVAQMTGQMHRALMRRFVPLLYGRVNVEYLRAMRALGDFFICAESPRHTILSLARMSHHLDTFHRNKHAIMAAGGRGTLGHWKIPKLELLSSFVPAIISGGCLPQWACQIVEALLRTKGKFPFQLHTNHQRAGYGEQAARYLDGEARIREFQICSLIKKHGASLLPDEPDENDTDDNMHEVENDVTRAFLEAATGGPVDTRGIGGPHRIRNLFEDGTMVVDNRIAFHVKIRPDAILSLEEAAAQYALPFLPAAIQAFVASVLGSDASKLPVSKIRVWHRYHIQRHSVITHTLRPQQTLRAQPPGEEYPLGLCDAVLVNSIDPQGIPRAEGPLVVQIRTVFDFNVALGADLPDALKLPLVYAQDFECADVDDQGRPARIPGVLMYRLRRRLWTDERGTVHRTGFVIPLKNVEMVVDLVLVHGHTMDAQLNKRNAMELPSHFFLNDQYDLETNAALSMIM